MSKEQVIKFCIEIDPKTKDWILDLERKYMCESHKELLFLALRFLDETPYEQLPFEIRGAIGAKGETEIPSSLSALRWMDVERIQHEIDSFVVKTNNDKALLIKLLAEKRKLLDAYIKDDLSKELEEIKEIKQQMLENMQE